MWRLNSPHGCRFPLAPVAKVRRGLLAVTSPGRMLLWLWAAFWLIMILVAIQDRAAQPVYRVVGAAALGGVVVRRRHGVAALAAA